MFVKSLGLEMNVYETNLGIENEVYDTKYRPNQSGHARVCNLANAEMGAQESSTDVVRTSITANAVLETARIVALRGRVNFISEDVKSILSDGAQVETVQYPLASSPSLSARMFSNICNERSS